MDKNQQKEKIIEIIYSVIDEINQDDDSVELSKDLDESLIGSKSKLDSLGLVNLIVYTEQNIEDEFSKPITIGDERAMSQKNSPFRTVGALADYIEILLQEIDNE